MIDRWHAAGMLLQHWLLKEDTHSIHSPALFSLYQKVFNPKVGTGKIEEAEFIRLQLKKDHRPVPTYVFGTKPSTPQKKRTVASVLEYEVAPREVAEMLKRLVRFQKAKRILEIGTCLGLTSLYLSSDPDCELVTLEGNPLLAEIAIDTFRKAGRTNIQLVQGNADETLPHVLHDGFRPDMVIVDANHRYEPTLRYLREIMTKSPACLTVVIDDIHYSKEMTAAWQTATEMFSRRLAINLGERGVLLADQEHMENTLFW